jgi:serine/threonine protein kinase/osmotically-inducible protein OsmY
MKRCPSCRRVYDRDSEVCQADGTPLADFNVDPLVGQTIAKRYRVVRRLGGGSLGTVYLATELATGKDIALKILAKELQCDDDALKQCRWDARFATASQPSNIVRVFEVNRTDEGQVFIAMEYLQGENLADMIRREGALELGRALRLASQIAQGLVAASRAGVPHRDLKPQNVVVVGPDERVKVTDFGVARLWRTTMGGARTRPHSVALEYTAPERLIGGDADDRTDVYGLAAMLYAMLTGAAPSTSASRGTADSEDLWQAPPPVRELRPEVPVALEQALLRAMEREPERRQSGMHEFAEGLLDLAATVIERKTRHAATLVVRESALDPSAPAPRVVPLPATEPATDRSLRESSLPSPERSHASQERRRERWQAYREHWQAQRGRWQEQWQAYRVQFQAYRELRQAQWQAYRVQFQAYQERRQAERLAYRAQLEAQRQAGLEQHQADRLAYHAQLEAQRQAAREQRQARRLRWQGQWRAYRVQFHSYRERRQAQRLAYRAQRQAQRQVYREQWQTRQERWQMQWQAYRARLQSYRESLQTGSRESSQALRERWRSRLEWARSSLGESTGRLTALASRSLGDSLRWGHANGGRLALGGVAALVVVGAMAWASLDRRAEAPAPVQSTAGRESSSVGEPGATAVASQILAAAPPRRPPQRAGRESSGVVDLAPSPPTPAGEGPKHPGRIQAERPQEAASPRPIAPAAEVEPEPDQPSPRPPLPEVEVDASARGSAEPASRPVSLSAQQISRIQTEAEQKLQHRGLLRVSATDRWGVTLETAPTGEVTLSGVLRDMVLYADAIRLVREVPGVQEVRGSVQVADAGTVSVAKSESARLQIEIQQRLRSGGLLRESASDRWGVLVEVSPEGDVTLVGAVRDVQMYRETIRRAQEVSNVRLVKQQISVMDRGNGQ